MFLKSSMYPTRPNRSIPCQTQVKCSQGPVTGSNEVAVWSCHVLDPSATPSQRLEMLRLTSLEAGGWGTGLPCQEEEEEEEGRGLRQGS
jgi:hypothetical protein